MSIDFNYTRSGDPLTTQFIDQNLTDRYNIVSCKTNEDGQVNYFAVNPEDETLVIYKDSGYEFHLQSDGTYWHPILTRDDQEFDIENQVLMDICSALELDLTME